MKSEVSTKQVTVFFAVTIAVLTLTLAIVSSQSETTRAVLLAEKHGKAAVHHTAVAPHEKIASSAKKAQAPLNAILEAAEKRQEAAEKAHKEKVLARAAKSALKEYSTLQEKAKSELQQQSAHVRSLVSSAARELIAEEAIAKQKKAEQTARPDGWGSGKPKENHASAAKKWRARMQEAERAALDVIQREDKASAKSTLAWKSYAQREKEQVEKVKKQEDLLEKKQDKHIANLVASGQLKASGETKKAKKYPMHKALIKQAVAAKSVAAKKNNANKPAVAKKVTTVAAKKVVKKSPVSPVAKSVKIAVSKAMRAAKAKPTAVHSAQKAAGNVMKEMKKSRKVRFIAKKQLPLLEEHMKSQEKSMEGRKSWHSLVRKAKVAETKRAKAWLKLVRQVRSEEKKKEVVDEARVAVEKKHLAYINKMIQSGNQKHLDRQVQNIIGKAPKAKPVAAKKHVEQAKKHVEQAKKHVQEARKQAAKAKLAQHHDGFHKAFPKKAIESTHIEKK